MILSRRLFTALQCAIKESTDLKRNIKSLIATERAKVKGFITEYGDSVICNVTLKMIYGGMRGIKGLVYETSALDPLKGIRFRGYSIPEVLKLLPKSPDGEQALPEGIFWLLLTGTIPTQQQVDALSQEWNSRSAVPNHVVQMLKSVPKNVHPMAQLSSAVTLMNSDSIFLKAYHSGVNKNSYWEYVYEDAMNLIARLPTVAAMIYRSSFKDGKIPATRDDKDWTWNFCTMLGYDDKTFTDLMRMYLVIHCDHEGGNVSAHSVHLVGSALSDPYLSFAAGLNGLAGPLHGLANQEVLIWLLDIQKEIGDKIEDDEELKRVIERRLKAGKVIPGYGHAVLRTTDPRYTCQSQFGRKHMPDDPLFQLVSRLYKIVPPILDSLGKVQNPWPNVDAHSGVLLYHYGMKEMSYYTVLFGISRALGTMAALIWSRALAFPIERPKSCTTEDLMMTITKSKVQ